jgi:hypothetical protein
MSELASTCSFLRSSMSSTCAESNNRPSRSTKTERRCYVWKRGSSLENMHHDLQAQQRIESQRGSEDSCLKHANHDLSRSCRQATQELWIARARLGNGTSPGHRPSEAMVKRLRTCQTFLLLYSVRFGAPVFGTRLEPLASSMPSDCMRDRTRDGSTCGYTPGKRKWQ